MKNKALMVSKQFHDEKIQDIMDVLDRERTELRAEIDSIKLRAENAELAVDVLARLLSQRDLPSRPKALRWVHMDASVKGDVR